VRIHAKDELAAGLPEDEIADGCALRRSVWHVAVIAGPILKRLQGIGARAGGIVINNQEFDVRQDFGVVKADRLNREVNAIIIVVSGHADSQKFWLSARCWFGNGRQNFEGVIQDFAGALEEC